MNKAKIEHYQKQYGGLLAFLVIELLLFTSLNLANYGILFRYLSIVLAAALIPITMLKYRQEDWLNVALAFILPLFAYGAFMAFSPLYSILQSIVDNIAMVLSLIAFLLIGISMAHNEEFQIQKGLSAIVGLGCLAGDRTRVHHVALHILLCAALPGHEPVFRWEAYLVSNEAMWLFGLNSTKSNWRIFPIMASFLHRVLLDCFSSGSSTSKSSIWYGSSPERLDLSHYYCCRISAR
jgi:hypothetical protein